MPQSRVSVFIESPQGAPALVQELWEHMGVEAWTAWACMEANRAEEEEHDWWEANSPVNGREPDDDEETDMGPDEPDEYGGTELD